MVKILIAHADGDEALAAEIARPLEAAGYHVVHHGSLFVGDSLMQQASQAIAEGSPVVLCGSVRAIGTGWAHFLVNAARRYGQARIFALQMEEGAFLDFLTLDGRVARYWQDPAGAIGELMAALSEYYPTPRPAGADQRLDLLEQRYRELALETCDIVDLANFPIGDRELLTRSLLLRSLYVSLRVAVDIPPGIDPHDLDKKLHNLEARRKDQDGAQDTGSRFSVGERLAHSNRLVVLGDPGAGKSTLLRWIATAYLLRLKADPDWSQLPDVDTLPDTDWLPLFIRCRDLDRRRLTGSLEEMIQHHLCDTEFSSDEAADLTPLLLGRLREGRVLLLIDGLDEISDPALRARFCRKVEKIHVAFPKAPIIVTSRIVGYREMKLRITRGFEHVTVQDLTPEDKDDFARRWCVVTEPPIRRELATEQLISDIHSTDRIERLTGSPMLLTTMALVKKKVGKLPSRRADLYREAVDVLLHWRSDVDERMDPREALPQLQYLAYYMCDSGEQQIRQDTVLDVLERMRGEFPDIHAVQQRPPVEFLRRLERQTGILVESGHVHHDGHLVPVYEFRHLTFQEYLAGLALVAGRYPGRDRQRSLAQQIAELAAETAPFVSPGRQADVAVTEKWREAIRLSVMTCNDDHVNDVLRAIATPLAGEDAATTARPRATLACACLADEPNVSKEVAQEVVTRFVAALTTEDGSGPEFTIADTVLKEVGNSRFAALLSRTIVARWIQDPSEYHRLAGSASVVLGEAAPSEKEALRTWVRNQVALLKEPEAEVATEAALALMDVAYRGTLVMVPGLVPGLISMLTRGPCEATAAAWALMWIKGPAHNWWPSAAELQELTSVILTAALPPDAVTHLLWCFDEAPAPRREALAERVMEAFASATAATRNQIADQYQTLFRGVTGPVISATRHQRYEVRVGAALLLKRLDNSLALQPLLKTLTDEHGVRHSGVVEALGALRDSRALDPLLALLRTSHGTADRVVAKALGDLGDPRALPPLLGLLLLPHGTPDTFVVHALGNLGDRGAVEPLLSILTTQHGKVNGSVAYALGHLGDSRAVQPLLEALPLGDNVESVVTALGRLGDSRAVGPLLDALATENIWRPAVARALGRLGDSQAVEPLLGLLPTSRGELREAVIEALGLLGDKRAVEPLLSTLPDLDDDPEPFGDDQRLAVLAALCRIGDARAITPLTELRANTDPELYSALRAALAALGDTTARSELNEAMTGSNRDARRSALWSLATLDPDEVNRVLLSKDLDGLTPGIDPQMVIEESTLRQYAAAVHLPVPEVRARYEQLADRYPLRLAWRRRSD
ncbi:HEAT repeat domain-containing protein [Streptomyces sp. NPDC020489]|uniref:HEAT repeat domain-containing protein n=1 Tax=Streptomyces sp. NPDC020489 TaxID=3365077 RepID=UPI0037B0CC60